MQIPKKTQRNKKKTKRGKTKHKLEQMKKSHFVRLVYRRATASAVTIDQD